jgi:hypothetical protein
MKKLSVHEYGDELVTWVLGMNSPLITLWTKRITFIFQKFRKDVLYGMEVIFTKKEMEGKRKEDSDERECV